MRVWVGIDNGVTGSVGIIREDGEYKFFKSPVRRVRDYTKRKKYIRRIDVKRLREELLNFIGVENLKFTVVMIERPLVNPMRFNSTGSALRALEATLIVLEELGLMYSFIDSRHWQRGTKNDSGLFPRDISSEDLKGMSLKLGNELFPDIINIRHPDRDGILIAEWIRRRGNEE